jgi:hypothetical protein
MRSNFILFISYLILYFSDTTDIISKLTHDAIVKKLADNISTISQDIKVFSAQAEMSRTTQIPGFLNTSDASLAAPGPPVTSVPSLPLTLTTTFTRLPLPQLNRKDYLNVLLWFPDNYNDGWKGGK